MSGRNLGALLFLGAAWGGAFLFIRVAGPAFGPAVLALLRVTVAAGLLLMVLSWAKLNLLEPRSLGRLVILGALNAAIPYYLIARAELHLTASLAAMLGATQALWGVLVGAVFLGERPTAVSGMGFLVGAGGVALLVGFNPAEIGGPTGLSVLAILGATLSYASASAYAKAAMNDIGPLQLAFGQQLSASLLLIGPAAFQNQQPEWNWTAIAATCALASISTAGAYVVYFKLIRSIGPTKANLVTFLSPAFGVLWGRVFLHETISIGALAGFGLILSSLVLTTDAPLTFVLRRKLVGRGHAMTASVTELTKSEEPQLTHQPGVVRDE